MTILTLYIAEFGPFFRWNIPNFYFIFRLFCYSNLCKTWKSCRNPLSKLYRLNEYCHLLCRKTTVFRCLKTPWKYRLGTRFFGWFHSYISYYTGCYSLFFCRLFFSLWSPTIPVGCFIWGCPVLFCMLTLWVAVCVLPLYVPSWLLRISPFWSFGKGVGGRVRSRKFRCCNSACGVNQMKKGRNPRWISAWKVCAFSVFR